MKHTPGPWYLAKLSKPEHNRLTRLDFEVRPPDSHCSIAFLVIGQDASREDHRAVPAEVEANARLIAAAPDLLEALQTLEGQASIAAGQSWKTEYWEPLANAIQHAQRHCQSGGQIMIPSIIPNKLARLFELTR